MSAKSQKSKPITAKGTGSQQLPLSRAEAYRLHQVLVQLKSLVAEPRYLYALVMTRKRLQPLSEAVDEMMKPSQRIQLYEQQRQVLCNEFSSKHIDGKPVISAEQHFVIDPQRQSEFNGRLESLQSEFQTDIIAYQTSMTQLNAFLDESSEFTDLERIPVSAIRAAISMEHMEALFPILVTDRDAR